MEVTLVVAELAGGNLEPEDERTVVDVISVVDVGPTVEVVDDAPGALVEEATTLGVEPGDD